MSDLTVPDILSANFCECPARKCEVAEGDDINWCTGFWNELVRENPPSLYPDSPNPIFSSKEYDWEDPLFLENVFACPDVDEVFSGPHLSGRPEFSESSIETKPNEDIYSVYPAVNASGDINAILVNRSSPSSTASKQKKKRPMQSKAANGQEMPSKRKCSSTARKTKGKK